jgi:predicted protein tyrosine phosphatase
MTYTDFHWIDDHVAIGGFVTQSDHLPFDAILSMETHAPPGVRDLVHSETVDYQWRSIIDGIPYEGHEEIVRRFDSAAEQIHQWVESDKRVLVHCFAGVSRSVTAVIWYLMRYRGMTWDEALAMIRASRAVANPNIRFEIPLRIAAGEVLTDEWIRDRIRAYCALLHEQYNVNPDPQEIWDTLTIQGTLDARNQPAR